MNQMKKTPKYAKDSVYQELANLCEQAGYHIVYTDKIYQGAYAMTDTFEIRMPLQNEFHSDEHAALVLGHELAHRLTENWYLPDQKPRPDGTSYEDFPLHVVIEADCDRIGAALYELAEKIANKKAENAFVAACKEAKK